MQVTCVARIVPMRWLHWRHAVLSFFFWLSWGATSASGMIAEKMRTQPMSMRRVICSWARCQNSCYAKKTDSRERNNEASADGTYLRHTFCSMNAIMVLKMPR